MLKLPWKYLVTIYGGVRFRVSADFILQVNLKYLDACYKKHNILLIFLPILENQEIKNEESFLG